MESSTVLESVLLKAAWQRLLFVEKPRRSELLKLKPKWQCRDLLIRVHRNHSFEHVATMMQPYLALVDWQGSFLYSDYDDSLSYNGAGSADVEIIWLDYDRFEKPFAENQLGAWLGSRVQALRSETDAPILVANWDDTHSLADKFNSDFEIIAHAIPDVRVCDRRPIRHDLGDRYWDERAAVLSGTRLSDRACILTARDFACHWIPAALQPRLKALVVDLDNTLYTGVLGEDGPLGVTLSPGHQALQSKLLELRDQGIFLGLVSRNEFEDVRRLFDVRSDFPVKWNSFSAYSITWQDKAMGIARIAEALRISIDSMVLLDDNPGELAAVAQAYPQIHTIHADADAFLTTRTLFFYPGLWSYGRSETDAVRVADLEASAERDKLLSQAANGQDYVRSLAVRLTFSVNSQPQLERLAELSHKTNQFNLSLSRLGQTELAHCFQSADCRVVSIRLVDRLSDSGIVGLVVGRREGDALHVQEVCVSCRALGRQLEDVMLGEAVRLILAQLPAREVQFHYRIGPRNAPARMWLEKVTGAPLPGAEGSVLAPGQLMQPMAADVPVEIILEARVGP